MRSFRILAAFTGLTLTALLFGAHTSMPTASALSGQQFQAGRIIEDGLFFNGAGFSAEEIQAFLNAKQPSCDTNGDKPYGNTTRREYSATKGYYPPFTCLKDYQQTTTAKPAEAQLCNGYPAATQTAAQIIHGVAQSCGISAKALIVLLQKEQSLVTDDWPWSIQYRSATGYGCPDTAPCDTEYYGFFNQVYSAARQFKYYAKFPNSFNHIAGRNNFVLYNPNSSCGGSTVYIHNQATAGLYNYTPYQPNQAALNNLYGTGDACSAYGNRNFWRMYNDWFGPTNGTVYAWQLVSVSYSTNTNVFNTNEAGTVTVKAKNISNVPWYNHGAHPVRLGTWEPGRVSPLHSPGWLSPTRPANMIENSVAPDGIATFTFPINVPENKIGTYVEALNLVVENAEWMPWPGLSPTIQINRSYGWDVTSVSHSTGTTLMDPGDTQTVTVRAKNTGTKTWNKTSGPAIRLGTWEPGRTSRAYHSSWISPIRMATHTEATVAPGQTGTFTFTVRAGFVGDLTERINLVAEGLTWFNDEKASFYLFGRQFSWEPLWLTHSTGTAAIPRNTTFMLTLKAKNTGTSTWKKGGDFPVRLGTVSPIGRGSNLFHSSWIRDFRPVGLTETTVPPGGTGTFTFTAQTPATAGERYEYFSLVAEGLTWFNDPGFYVYVKVL